MGYTLARPCRKCGCGILVPTKDEKARKDAEGVDEHTYDIRYTIPFLKRYHECSDPS